MNSKNEILKKIAQHLMLNASFADTSGLLNGKMGVVVFFFHYAKYSKKSIYKKFAYELLDEIYEDICPDTPVDFKDGLSGIAWGIDYFICNNSVDIDDKVLLDELDELITKTGINEIQDSSVETGLKGLAHYVISRKSNALLNHSTISTNYVRNLIAALSQANQEEEATFLIQQLYLVVKEIRPIYEHDRLLRKIVRNVVYDPNLIFSPHRLWGIDNNGYAGIGLKLIWDN